MTCYWKNSLLVQVSRQSVDIQKHSGCIHGHPSLSSPGIGWQSNFQSLEKVVIETSVQWEESESNLRAQAGCPCVSLSVSIASLHPSPAFTSDWALTVVLLVFQARLSWNNTHASDGSGWPPGLPFISNGYNLFSMVDIKKNVISQLRQLVTGIAFN